MEHIRLLLAIVLTIMVFVLWEVLFVPTQAPEPPAEPGRTEKSEQTDTREPPREEGQSDAGTEGRDVSAEDA
ncbi:MAG: hypothetical protein ACLFUY_09530, partial [Desulfobacterales bacterium]